MIKKIIAALRHKQPQTFFTFAVFAVMLALSVGVSMQARYNQLSTWQSYPGTFYSTGTPMMTTLDSYKFIRHAKEYRSGVYDTSKSDPMIFYPDDSPYPNPVPLLSVTLDFLSQKTGYDLYTVGVNLIPVISSLFIIPLAIYFMILGYPAAGIMGGLIGTFAPMFYGRSAMGRLDTDGLNFFFLITASLFVLLASRAKSKWLIYLFSALTGGTIWIFYTWYHHGMFNLFYLAVLLFALLLAKVKIRDIAISLLIYILCSNPIYMFNAFSQLYHAINVYLLPVKEIVATQFPNVYDTISEAQRSSPIEALSSVTQNPYIALAGLAGCVIMACVYFRPLLPLAPFLMMGLMTFVSAGRFSMFLGPIAGVGIGYLITIACSYIPYDNKWLHRWRGSFEFIAVGLIFLTMTITGNNAYKYLSSPSINAHTYQLFKDIKEVLPANSAIYTWWDYGLAITDATGFPVFHSGMTQETPKTWVIAKSLTSDQKTLYNIASYLDTYGIAEIGYLAEDKIPLEDISSYISNYDEGPMNNADYILITDDMVDKYPPISYLASWSLQSSKGTPRGFNKLKCSSIQNNILTCSGATVNLGTGVVNSRSALKETIFLNNGNIKERIKYNFASGDTVIIDAMGETVRSIYLIEQDLMDTAFVQLYFLNEADPKYFTNVYDKYPYGRLFRLNMKAGQ